jgi:hypothetical protein
MQVIMYMKITAVFFIFFFTFAGRCFSKYVEFLVV